MTDYGTIKIPREDYEHHNGRRKEMGLEWVEYIDAQADEWTLKQGVDVDTLAQRIASHTEGLGNGGGVDTEALVNDLVAQLPPRIADELQ